MAASTKLFSASLGEATDHSPAWKSHPSKLYLKISKLLGRVCFPKHSVHIICIMHIHTPYLLTSSFLNICNYRSDRKGFMMKNSNTNLYTLSQRSDEKGCFTF